MMQYNVLGLIGLGVHGTDHLPVFWNEAFDMVAILIGTLGDQLVILARLFGATLNRIAHLYQSYFASHAMMPSMGTQTRGEG